MIDEITVVRSKTNSVALCFVLNLNDIAFVF